MGWGICGSTFNSILTSCFGALIEHHICSAIPSACETHTYTLCTHQVDYQVGSSVYSLTMINLHIIY